MPHAQAVPLSQEDERCGWRITLEAAHSATSGYEQLARQWLFLAEKAEAETFNRRNLIVRDPVLLCAPPRSYS
jgi:hypothetical protein